MQRDLQRDEGRTGCSTLSGTRDLQAPSPRPDAATDTIGYARAHSRTGAITITRKLPLSGVQGVAGAGCPDPHRGGQ